MSERKQRCLPVLTQATEGSEDVGSHGLREIASAISDGKFTSQYVIRDTLDRIEKSQPTLNAFRVIRRGAALAEAADADHKLSAGERLPLLGVPIAVKDDTDVAGQPTAFGCAGRFSPAEADAEVVRLLRAAGAIIVGKTNTSELGQWPVTEGTAFGYTRNPWSSQHTPGGSSGGSAAAVAAGLVPAAVGSDAAGSIRIPAAWTNLVGIKPQRNRVSTLPLVDAVNGLVVYGPLARTTADAAFLLDVITDKMPPHAETFSTAAATLPRRLRVAIALRPPFVPFKTELTAEVYDAVQRVAQALRELGHEVTAHELDFGTLLPVSFLPRSAAGVRRQLDRFPGAEVDKRTRLNARSGRVLGGLVLATARRAERKVSAKIGRVFGCFDVVLTPTTATPPLPIHALTGLNTFATSRVVSTACPYTWAWNVVGWPSISVPAGFTKSNLPLGVQLMGPAASEGTLISLAAQLESELQWHRERPRGWW